MPSAAVLAEEVNNFKETIKDEEGIQEYIDRITENS